MVHATVRRVGNSLGIVIPKAEAERQKLREGDRVDIQVRKADTMESLFGLLKGKLGPVDEANKLADEGEDL